MSESQAQAPAHTWQRARRGAYVGVIVGINAWVLALCAVIATRGSLATMALPLGVLIAWSLAITALTLSVLELSIAQLGFEARMLPLWSMLCFAIGGSLVLYDSVVTPAMAKDPELLAYVERLGGTLVGTTWLGAGFLLVSALLFVLLLRRMRRS